MIKESSSTTKLRVVFDGSCKSSSGVSVNDKLMICAVVQDELVHLLLRFRKHVVGVTADIKQMYRQIRVAPEDTEFQRILWRDSSSDPIEDYRLLTVTYGTASAPYQATRCLIQLAENEK